MIHPNSLANLQRGRKDVRVPCPHCENLITKPNLNRHILKCVNNPDFGTPCPNCGILKHPDKKTCSTGCYNSLYRSGLNNPNYSSKSKNYRTTCFIYHEKKCCICGWDLVVEVHHFDSNRENNSPENLIPLCPNHHHLWHSNKRRLIKDQVEKYREDFKEKMKVSANYNETE